MLNQGICPSCGYCPTCGQRKSQQVWGMGVLGGGNGQLGKQWGLGQQFGQHLNTANIPFQPCTNDHQGEK